MNKKIQKLIEKLTLNENERQRLTKSVETEIEDFNGKVFYKTKRRIGNKWKTVLLPLLNSQDMKDYLLNKLETIRLARFMHEEYERGNIKPIFSM